MHKSFSRRDKLDEWDQSLIQLNEQIKKLNKSDRIRNSFKWEHISEDISSLAAKERALSVKIQNLFRLINDQSLQQGKNQTKLAKMLKLNLELCLKSNLEHKHFILKKCWQKVAKIQMTHLLGNKKIDPNKHPKEALKHLKLKQQSLFCDYKKLKHKQSYDSALTDLQRIELENSRAVDIKKAHDSRTKTSFSQSPEMLQLKQLLDITNIDTERNLKSITSFRETFLTYQKHSKKIFGRYRTLCQKILDNRTDNHFKGELMKLAEDIAELQQLEKALDSTSKKLLKPKVRSARILVKKQESDAFTV